MYRVRDSKVHGDNMGLTWVLSAPVGPMLATGTLLSGCSPTCAHCVEFHSAFMWFGTNASHGYFTGTGPIIRAYIVYNYLSKLWWKWPTCNPYTTNKWQAPEFLVWANLNPHVVMYSHIAFRSQQPLSSSKPAFNNLQSSYEYIWEFISYATHYHHHVIILVIWNVLPLDITKALFQNCPQKR